MRANCGWLAVAALGLAGSPGYTQDEDGFSGRVALGYLATSGNSASENLNANFDLWWNYDPLAHSFSGQAINASTSGVTTAEAYGLAWQSDYTISETGYVFGLIALDRDGFSAYGQQARVSLGYGRRLIDRETHIFNAEAGLGARQAELRDGAPEDESILHLAGDYRWIIGETSQFTQTLMTDSGSNNTYVEAESSLSASIRENFALVVSYTIQHNSDVLPGTQNTDQFTAISLEYTF